MSARFVDAHALADGAAVAADVCVVGAGAAGIVLAIELAAAGHRTLLLEAGGMDEDPWTTALFDGPNVGAPYFPLRASRAHRFGGTTYKYGGHSTPVRRRDFDPVLGVPLASWPVTYDDVAPWAARAAARLGHTAADFDVEHRMDAVGLPRPDPRLDAIAGTAVFVRDRVDEKPYPERLASELAAARGLEIVLHAVVTRVFVAGSSVFCRATFSPTTMTIVAFALRLADHLDGRLRAGM